MNSTFRQKLSCGLTFFISMLFSLTGYAQGGTSILMTMQNVVQTAPNTFEYDVMLTNTGSTSLAIRGYSCGINHASGMNGSGTLTQSFISRDPSLSTIPAVNASYTAASNHMRFTTLNAAAGSEVAISAGVPIRLATVRVTNTVNFPSNFNPAFTLQLISATGKTPCLATCIVTPPGTSYAINSVGNTPAAGTLQLLSGAITAPCFYLNPSAAFAMNATAVSPVTCFGQSNGTAQMTLSGAGSTALGSYTINGGASIAYTGNPFLVSGLPAGTHTITVNTSNACTSSKIITITQPVSQITTTINGIVCNSGYTLPWGTLVTSAGAYTHTYVSSGGCDSIVTVNLTAGSVIVNPPQNVSACNSYLWPLNGQTYTASGTYTASFNSMAGCDSNYTLNLTINQNSSASFSATACDSYLWAQNNVTYTASGIYVVTGTNAQGCADTHTLNLTIHHSTSGITNASVSGSYTWAVNGQTYTASGVYQSSYTSIYGCDSTLTLNLTILQVGITMTLQNAVQIAPNMFEYDVMLTNTGSTPLALRGYSCGINHTAGMNGGGTITHTYISRDPLLATIPTVSAGYTAASNHIRITTLNAAAGSEVSLPTGLPVRLATMRITSTANFPTDFNPALALQLATASGKTQCVATCIVTPPGSSYVLNSPGNTPTGTSLQVLSGVVNTPCFYLNQVNVFSISASAVSQVACYGQSNGSAQLNLSGSGAGTSGNYKINGGADIAYSGSSFSLTNLSAGSYTISATSSVGCTASTVINITQPSSSITTSFSGIICNGSYTLPWGVVVTTSGIYSYTYVSASGCDSVVTANLMVGLPSVHPPVTLSACDAYVWAVNNQTYTASGTYTANFLTVSGCDSNYTLNLTINHSSSVTSSATSCDSYTWPFNNQTYTASGNYVATVLNVQGCLDTHTLNLIIKHSSASTTTAAVSSSYTWAANGQTYTAGGVYTFTLTNAAGCDSVLTLNLSVIQIAVNMTLQHVVQTAPNVFEYDVVLTNTGTTPLALRGYSFGINHAAGMNGGGTLTHSYVSRDPSLVTLTSVSAGYTAATNHMRLTTIVASLGNEVALTAGVPVRIATMRMTNTVNFPADFNPAFALQLLAATGKTVCIATCMVYPGGATYNINSPGNIAAGGSLQNLTALVNAPCLFLNPSSSFVATISGSTQVACYGQNTGSAEVTLSGTGSGAPGGSNGTYKINGGAAVSYSTNPFTISNLSAGTYTVSVTTSYGCTSSSVLTITQPSSPIESTIMHSFCSGSYTLPWGSVVSATGIYTHTYTAANGCDSTVTVNLYPGAPIINPSTTVTACDAYVWGQDNQTYTASGTYTVTYLNESGCDSNYILYLTVNHSSIHTTSATACNSYTWTLNGVTYTTSGVYMITGTNATGCPDTNILNLTIRYSSTSVTNAYVFNSYTWAANAQTYTSSGVYSYMMINAAGCDSTLTLNLTILQMAVNMTMQNIVQTAPNVFEYDLMLNYTGNSGLALRAYSCGINYAAGMSGGGTLTHSFVSRDASLSTIPAVNASYTASSNHLRLTTTSASAGNEVMLTSGVQVRLATMRVTSTTNFPTDFNPAFALQMLTSPGKTVCVATGIIVPPGSNYSFNAIGNIPAAGTLQLLTGAVNATCLYLNPSAPFTATTTNATSVACYGQSTGSAQITLSGAGSVSSGTYTMNGGPAVAYNTNPFAISNLPAGTYSINVNTANGCSSSSTLVITQPASAISTSSTILSCDSYVWNGNNYTNSGTYSHTFTTASGCDSVHTLYLTVHYSNAGSSNVAACGSYDWNGITYTASGSYTQVFTNAAGCDSTHTLHLVLFSNTGSSAVSACESYSWNGNNYTQSGSYTHTYTSSNGCDSIHTLYLTIHYTTYSVSNIAVVSTYLWPSNGVTYTTGGVYTMTTTNTNGCDSILTLNLTVLQESASVSLTIQNAVQIAPNQFTYDVMLTNTGTVALSLRGYSCGINHAVGMKGSGNITHSYVSRDTSLALLPSVSPGYTAATNHIRLTTLNASPGNEVVLPGNVPVRLATMKITTSASSFPTDFNPELNLQTLAASGKTTCMVTCIVTPPGTNFSINSPGNIPAVNSLQVMTSAVNTPCFFLSPSAPFSTTAIADPLCYGQTIGSAVINLSGAGSSNATGTYQLDGGSMVSFTSNPFSLSNLATGTHTINITTSNNCNSAAILNLQAPSSPLTVSTSVTACDSYVWNGNIYTASGLLTSTFVSVNGCDSVHTVNLTINYSNSGSSNVTSCNSYVWNGITYTTNGNPTHTYTNAAGCDSVHTLHLTINYSNTGSSNVTSCNSYVWNGITYTTSGNPTHTYTNASGCDSVHTLHLTINYSNTGSSNVTSCNSYVWNGITYTTSGNPTHTYTNAAGCDSVHTLHLTINYSNSGSSNVTSCNSYVWNGITYTVSGNPTHTYTNVAGCDSVHTLHLTVNYSNTGSSIVSACNSYTWNGITYTASSNPVHIYTNASGCDSIHTLHLTIHQSNTTSINVVVPNSYTWALTNTTYTNSGVYLHTMSNMYGCDSIVSLHLSILTIQFDLDQEISCYGNNDGTVSIAGAGGSGNFVYDIDGANLYTNQTGYFIGLAPGVHTVCAKELPSNVVMCGTVVVTEPSPLSATFTIDSMVSCGLNNGQISVQIAGGTVNAQPYLTVWTNAVGDTLNDQLTNNFATTISGLPSGQYHLMVEDDHGCTFNTDTNLIAPICDDTLSLKLFFQGYYTGSSYMTPVLFNQGVSLNTSVTDTIIVELHDQNFPYSIVDSKMAILYTDGSASCSFSFVHDSSYYLAIKHRNGLPTWSSTPVHFATSTIFYDFSSSSGQAFGNNMYESEPGVWSFYSGDLNQDENIDLLDALKLEDDMVQFLYGYEISDLNGDGNVDLLDIPTLQENIDNFIYAVHP